MTGYPPDVTVEVAFNSGVRDTPAGRVWTDVSDYVELDQEIGITGGRPDEKSAAEPNTMSLVVDNSDGRFSPGYSSGAYYPNVKIGRPIRVKTTYPPEYAANLLAAGDADLEAGVGNWVATGSPAPTLSSDASTVHSGSKSLKVTWNGSGSFPQAIVSTTLTALVEYTVALWVYVPTGAPDVRLVGGTSQTALSSIKDQWHRLELTFTQGASATVSVGIRSSGTPSSSVCYVDDAMLVYGDTIAEDFNNDPVVTSTRFVGFVDEWPTDWPAGADNYATSRVTATSRRSRMSSGRTLRSPIREATLALDPAAYYTLATSDAADSTGSSEPLEQTGGSYKPVAFDWDQGDLYSTETVAKFGASGTLTQAPAYLSNGSPSGDSLTEASISVFYQELGTTEAYVLTGNGLVLYVFGDTVTALVHGYGAVVASAAGTDVDDGAWHHLAATYDGTTLRVYLDGTEVDDTSGSPTFTDSTGVTMGNIPHPLVSTWTSMTMRFAAGHASVFDYELTAAQVAELAEVGLNGYVGDTAAERLARYADLAGVDAGETDFDAAATTLIAFIDTTGVGPLEAMQKVEATDGGVLYDARDGALAYQAPASRYAATPAATLSFLSGHLAPPNVIYDRSQLVNSVTANYGTGSAVQATDSASKNDYDEVTTSVDLASDDYNVAHSTAWWLIDSYAEPRERIPNLGVMDLTQMDATMLAGMLGIDVGSLVATEDWPAQAPATDLDFFVEGYAETIGLASHRMTFNVSPGDLWLNTFKVGDNPRGTIGDVYRIAR